MLTTHRGLSILAFAVLLTVGASFASANGAQQIAEVPTLRYMVPDIDGIAIANPLKLYDKISKDCNVKLEVIVAASDGWNDKFNVLVSSGDLPDTVFILGNQAQVNELGQKGILLPFSDNLAKTPILAKLFAQHPDDLKYLMAANGKVYATPCVHLRTANTKGIILREDVLRKNGFDINSIKTTDDLYNAFLVLQKANDGNPVMGDRGGTLAALKVLSRMFGVWSIGFLGDLQYNLKTRQFDYPLSTPAFRDAMLYFSRMYKDGILSPDILSMTDEVFTIQLRSGKLLASADSVQNAFNTNQKMASLGFSDANMLAIVPPAYAGTAYPWRSDPQFLAGLGDIINAKSKVIDGALRMEEWLYDAANREFLAFGVEGQTFTRSADGTLTITVTKDVMNKVWGCNGNNIMFNRYLEAYPGYAHNEAGGFFVKVDPKVEAAKWRWVDVQRKFYTLPPDPPVTFTGEESDRLKTIKTPLDTYISENLAKFVLNTKPMTEWDSFIAGLGQFDVSGVLKVYNDALKRVPK